MEVKWTERAKKQLWGFSPDKSESALSELYSIARSGISPTHKTSFGNLLNLPCGVQVGYRDLPTGIGISYLSEDCFTFFKMYSEDGSTYWYDSAKDEQDYCQQSVRVSPKDMKFLCVVSDPEIEFAECTIGAHVPHEVHIESYDNDTFVSWRENEPYQIFEAPPCMPEGGIPGAPGFCSDPCRLPEGHEGPHPW